MPDIRHRELSNESSEGGRSAKLLDSTILANVELIAIYVTRQLHQATREKTRPIPFAIHICGLHSSALNLSSFNTQ